MVFVWSTLAVLAATYAFLLVYAWLHADRLVFQPGPSTYRDGNEIIKIPGSRGEPMSAVYLSAPPAGSDVAVLYLHGNAEDLGDILPRLRALQAAGFAVLAIDYRGYGTTGGAPTETNVFADAAAAFAHLTTALRVAPERVLLYGRSLGSGPAIDLAAKNTVGGLVLEGAFVSAFRVVTHIPLLPYDRFANLAKLRRVRCPVLVIHGTADGTVPFYHGAELYAAADEPKFKLWIDGAHHNTLIDVAGDAYWRALRDFVDVCRKSRAKL